MKESVTPEELKKHFEQYGEISSCIVRKPEPNAAYAEKNPDNKVATQFGFINFADREQAKKAIDEAKSNPEIQNLYEKVVYLSYHIKKD